MIPTRNRPLNWLSPAKKTEGKSCPQNCTKNDQPPPETEPKPAETRAALGQDNMSGLETGHNVPSLYKKEKKERKKTTTTGVKTEKMYENDFINASTSCIERLIREGGDERPKPPETFAIEKLRSLYKRLPNPEPILCAQIVVSDWRKHAPVDDKTGRYARSQPTTEEMTDTSWSERYDFDFD